jgi:hypothetical protein
VPGCLSAAFVVKSVNFSDIENMRLYTEILSLSILIAGIIAIIRFGKISRMYYPFIFCVWAAGLNEILSCALMETGHHTTINNNIYVLIEAILFTTFFRSIGIFEKLPNIFTALISGLVLLWVWENFYLGKITSINSWFRITYSFIIVLMSITAVNKLVILDINKPLEINSRHILKHPVLIICIGTVAYFTFKVLVEVFWLYGLNSGKEFRAKLYDIMVYLNLAVNLIYALAILWVPPKQRYMNLY